MVIKKFVNVIYIILGFIALGFGVLGLILPVLPTTPLLLLASYFFVKGSEKFERWFKGTNLYKRHLESFIRERSMTLKQKLTILLFADIMIAIPFFLMNSFIFRVTLIAIVFYKYYYFIYKIKTIPEKN
ncbi:YbaN family protein [Bacillus sp. MRMR6]|uniref:YbaN family protein n=1 Tax=Bacillus sp. MRMR6 TaxID=1928617 RepID=UPI0020C957F5|nr:YbaN family protein [Bacillus sp. MRMR6]